MLRIVLLYGASKEGFERQTGYRCSWSTDIRFDSAFLLDLASYVVKAGRQLSNGRATYGSSDAYMSQRNAQMSPIDYQKLLLAFSMAGWQCM